MSVSQRVIVSIVTVLLGIIILYPIVILPPSPIVHVWIVGWATVLLIIAWESIHAMKPGVMVMLSFLGNIYSLYSPTKEGENGIDDSGLFLTYPPRLVKPIKLPTGMLEVPLLSNSANVTDPVPGETLKHITPVRVYMHLQTQLVQDEARLANLIHLLIGQSEASDYTADNRIQYYRSRDDEDNNDQVPKIEERTGPCLITKLIGLFQSAVDEAVTKALIGLTFEQARGAHEGIEKGIAKFLKESGTIFTKHELDKVFDPLDFTILAIVASDKAVRDAQSSGMTERLLAEGHVEREKGQARGLDAIGQSLAKAHGETAAKLQVANRMAAREGTTIINSGANVVETASSMLVDSLGKKPPEKDKDTP